MADITGYCGRSCSRCRAFAATKSSKYAWMDTTLKMEKELGINIDLQDVVCGGCINASQKQVASCRTCEIRQCCREMRLESCTSCAKYPCDTLVQYLKTPPFIQTCLEVLTKTMGWTDNADGSLRDESRLRIKK